MTLVSVDSMVAEVISAAAYAVMLMPFVIWAHYALRRWDRLIVSQLHLLAAR